MKKLLIIIVLISLVSCVNVNFHHTLYRNGNSDLIMEATSSNTIMIQALKNNVNETKGEVYEIEDGVKYVLKDVPLNELSDVDEFGIFSNAGIEKEFKFPYYYYYTVKFENQGFEMSSSGSDFDITKLMLGSMSFDYVFEPFGTIVETNGVYTDESKKAVKFDMLKNKNYTITFRDFFITSWIGGASKIIEKKAKKVIIAAPGELTENWEVISREETLAPIENNKPDVQEGKTPSNNKELFDELLFKESPYEPSDVKKAITEAKNLLDEQSFLEYLATYYSDESSYTQGKFLVLTPYAQAVTYSRDILLTGNFLDETKVKEILLSDDLQVFVETTADRPFSQRHAGVIYLYIQVGNKKYEATDLIINNEPSGWAGGEQVFKVTVLGKIPNYREYHDKNVDLKLNLDGIEKYYWLDLS